MIDIINEIKTSKFKRLCFSFSEAELGIPWRLFKKSSSSSESEGVLVFAGGCSEVVGVVFSDEAFFALTGAALALARAGFLTGP